MTPLVLLCGSFVAALASEDVCPVNICEVGETCELQYAPSNTNQKRLISTYLLRNLAWSSLVIHHEAGDAESLDIIDSVSEEHIKLMVFEFREANTSVQDHGDVPATVSLGKGARNVLVLGTFSFVLRIFQRILDAGRDIETFHSLWLTIVSGDGTDIRIYQEAAYVLQQFENFALPVSEKNRNFALWTMVREKDSVSQALVAEWSPSCNDSDVTLVAEKVFPNLKNGLGGRTLRMGTKVWDPFIIRHDSGNRTWYTGLCIDLLEYIARDLNFTYVITDASDGSWGQRLENGTWIGMTGMLARKEVDFALSGLSVSAERATVSDYTEGFFYNDVVLLVSRPVVQVGWTFFIRPFHWLVYTVIGVSLLLVTALTVCMERHGARGDRSYRAESASLGRSVVNTLQTSFGALIGRAVEYESVSNAGHVLLSAWLLLSLVTVAVYTGKLTAFSVVTKEKIPFSSLRQLVRQEDYRWGLIPGTLFESIISTAEDGDGDYERYYQGVLRFAADDPTVLSPNLEVHLAKVVEERYVLLTSSTVYQHLKDKCCRLAMIPERLFTDTIAVHLQKDSPYTRLFDKAIENAKELGLLDYWNRKWFPENTRPCDGDEREVITLTLELMQSAFALAGGGLAIAALTLGMEFLVKMCTDRTTYL